MKKEQLFRLEPLASSDIFVSIVLTAALTWMEFGNGTKGNGVSLQFVSNISAKI